MGLFYSDILHLLSSSQVNLAAVYASNPMAIKIGYLSSLFREDRPLRGAQNKTSTPKVFLWH